MDVPVTEAKAQLTDLVRRAEAGEDIVLTRHGQAVARLVALKSPISAGERRTLMLEVRAAARAKAIPGPDAARSQDFLYDATGLPA